MALSNGSLTGGKEPAGITARLTPGFVWYVVRRWGKLAVPLGIVTMLLAAGLVLYRFEPQYRAEALLQIKKQRPVVAIPIETGGSSEFVETQKQLLRSSPVVAKVLAKPAIARLPELRRESDPRKWIEKRLEVKPVGNSELFTVAYQGPSAESARLIVDAVVNAYFSLQATQNDDQVTKLLSALRSVKDDQVNNVMRLEKSVQELAKKNAGDTGLVVNSTGKSFIEFNSTLMELQLKLGQAEFDRQMTALQIKAYEEQSAGDDQPIPEAEIDEQIDDAPEVVDLEARLEVERKKLKALQRGTIYYQEAEKTLKDYETQLEKARESARERLVKEYRQRSDKSGRDRLAQMKTLLGEYQIRENMFRSRVEEEQRKIEGQTGNQYELEFLKNDLARAKQVADRIEDRIFGLTIEFLSPQRPEQVFVLQHAEAPASPIEAYPLKSMAMAGLAGLFLPLAAFGLFELLSRRLYQSNQLQDTSQLTLVSEIAALPSRPLLSYGGAVRRYLKDRAIFEESVESLRSILSVSPEWADAQVLAVSSAVSGEGKTSLASQLATGWARHGEARTLIIDGDVRDPDIYSIFGVASSPGLVEVLSGNCEHEAAIVHWEENLDILPAGTLIGSPHRLFEGQAFAALLEKLRKSYDRIVLDAAPLLSASEVLPMLKAVDGVLLCARKDHSRAAQVKLARDRLERAGIQRVGGVFGGLSCHSYAFQYGEYTG
jgi:capsular exopolysaccharide synthesis family protein